MQFSRHEQAATKRAEVAKVTDPAKRVEAEKKLAADVAELEAKKIESVSQLRRQRAVEDQRILASTAVETQRAMGNTYAGDRIAFEAAWREKIFLAQGDSKTVIDQRAAGAR